jgi:hypothetical protein
MKSLPFIFCILLLSSGAFSQTKNKMISGQVKDIQNEPLAGATVQLRKANDTTIIQSIVARSNGKFTFTGIENGSFVLNISSAGNKKYVSNPLVIDESHPVITLPVIILLPAKQTQLKEVVVNSKKPLIEQDIDKTIVNVEAMIGSATSNALEVLEKTPGITIDPDGTINLNGRSGVLVLIEGRSTYMSSQDLAAYLKSIPASTLDKIELMSNPPAKYDAAGSAVINIRFKRNRIQGYTGSLSLSFSQGRTNRSYNSLNLNYLNKKVNLFGSFSINKDRNFDDDNTHRIFYDNNNQKIYSTDLTNYNKYNSHDFSGRIGMDYTMSSKTTVGFIISAYNRNRKDGGDYTNNTYMDINTYPDSSGYGNSNYKSHWKQTSANINFQHKFNTSGRELSADINYVTYSNKAGQLLNNFIKSNSGGPDSNYIFRYDLPSGIDIYNVKADYSHPLTNKMVLSAGAKSSFVRNDKQSDYYDVINNNQNPDLSRSNHFIFTENINAFYINARKDWKRIGGQFGLRIENTNTKGNQLGNAIVVNSINANHYTGLFPSLFLSYKLDSVGKNILSINFSRRINRPNYQQLNPFISFIDQYSYNTGNPYLGPAFNYYTELSYRYKQFATVSLMYDRTNDAFFNATQAVNSKFITRPENASTRYLIAFQTNFNFSIAKWWRMNLNAATGKFQTKGNIYNQSLNRTQYAYRVNALNQFTFPKGWSGEIGGRCSSAIIILQRKIEPRWQVNAGIQKKILKGKGAVRLNIEDIFLSSKLKEHITGLSSADVYHANLQDFRRVGIAINFNFGKETFARKRRYNDNGADDVKNRVD